MNDPVIAPDSRYTRVSTLAPPSIRNANDRCIDFIFSDESVARDSHVIATAGWQLENFLANPVALWAHQQSEPPVGRVVSIEKAGGQLRGTIEFADAETYPFADTVFRLLKGGYLSAVSVSWLPLDWKYTTDKSRPGGIDFKRQELLEISVVPVPALASALVTARAHGIDTTLLFEWAERTLTNHDHVAIPRAELEALRRQSMPSSAIPARAADPVEPAEPEAAPVLTPAAPEPARKLAPTKRSLSQVSWLASLLGDLGYLQDMSAWEAEYYGDDPEIADQLLAALKSLGETLIAMTSIEVAKLIAGKEDDEIVAGDIVCMASGPGLKREAFVALRRLDDGQLAGLLGVARDLIAGRKVEVRTSAASFAPLLRVGKAISAANERCLRAAHEHVKNAAQIIGDVVDPPDDVVDDDGPDADDDNRALRVRKARALALKHGAR
jgi:HK97 family phage prohead protease